MSHSQNQVKYIRAWALANDVAKPHRSQPDAYNQIQKHLILEAKRQPNLARALLRIGARTIALAATSKKEN